MKLPIKQLKQGETIITPQTVAEAVLIKQGSTVMTLDKVINKKIDNITSSEELTITRNGNDIDITHSNQIQPINNPTPILLLYDSTGHITNSIPLGKLIIEVNNLKSINIDGTKDLYLKFDNNFFLDDKISIQWNNI